MNDLVYARIGRTTLWQGYPLRYAVRTEGAARYVGLDLMHLDAKEQKPEFHFELEQVEEADTIWWVEHDTSDMPPGAYEYLLTIDDEELFEPQEALLVLPQEQYRELLQPMLEETFDDQLRIPAADLETMAAGILAEVLGAEGYGDDPGSRGAPNLAVRVNAPPQASVSLTRASWVLRETADEFRSVALFGVQWFDWTVLLEDDVLRIEAEAELRRPLSDGFLGAIEAERRSGLSASPVTHLATRGSPDQIQLLAAAPIDLAQDGAPGDEARLRTWRRLGEEFLAGGRGPQILGST
jgi:hypothetical protein